VREPGGGGVSSLRSRKVLRKGARIHCMRREPCARWTRVWSRVEPLATETLWHPANSLFWLGQGPAQARALSGGAALADAARRWPGLSSQAPMPKPCTEARLPFKLLKVGDTL